MSLYAKSYERALKTYDSDLFVDHNRDGVLCVFKKHKRFEPVLVAEGFKLLNLINCKQYVFAVTDTWGLNGSPKDWGIDDILDHIQKIDSLANAKFLEEIDAANVAVDKSRDKKLMNEMQGMLAYERNRFVKMFDEIAPISGGMSKDEPKKRLQDRRSRKWD